LNRYAPFGARDFKSRASASFATRAGMTLLKILHQFTVSNRSDKAPQAKDPDSRGLGTEMSFGQSIAARCASKPEQSNYTYAGAAGKNLFASASILSASRPIDVRLVRVRCWGKINPKQNYIGVLIS
jgi:hypothetical protein